MNTKASNMSHLGSKSMNIGINELNYNAATYNLNI